MKSQVLLNKLGKKFPKKISKKWSDYVGLMCSKLPNEINRIVLCLDFDETIFEETIKFKPDIIFTHHPFIYGRKNNVLNEDYKKRDLVNRLEEINLPVYSFHTNFDEGKDGMNDTLAKLLNLENIYSPNDCPMMRIGYLTKEMDIIEFSKYAKKCLNIDYGHLIISNDKKIRKVGIIGGGGSGFYKVAMKENCDIFISGDVPHHVRREIIRYNFNYLDLPHEIEKAFLNQMEKILISIDPNFKILKIDHEKLPKVI